MKLFSVNSFSYGHCMPGWYACAGGGARGIIECHILLPVRRLYNEGVSLLIACSLLAGKSVGLGCSLAESVN